MKNTKNIKTQKSSTQKIEWFLKGFTLGIASLVPGVSAGTLALIMGIYEKCIFSITNLIGFSKKIKEDLSFLLSLTGGILTAIFCLATVISQLLTRFPLEVYSIFTGLIVASLPKLFKLTNKKRADFFLITLTAIAFLGFFKTVPGFSQPEHSLSLFFISGFLGFFASLLPGLSGSMILLLLGTYHFILNALAKWLMQYVLVFLTGGGLGLVCAFYFTRFFLKKRKNLFFCMAIGFILGGLPEVLPYEQWQVAEDKVFAGFRFMVFSSIGAGLLVLATKAHLLKKK